MQGCGGGAVFIDTNRGFSIDRVKSKAILNRSMYVTKLNFHKNNIPCFYHFFADMAKAMHDHCDVTYRNHNISYDRNEFTVNTIMSNIHCIFCNSFTDLLIAIVKLRALLTQFPSVKYSPYSQ